MTDLLIGIVLSALVCFALSYWYFRVRMSATILSASERERGLERKIGDLEQKQSRFAAELRALTGEFASANALAERLPAVEQALREAESSASQAITQLAVRSSELQAANAQLESSQGQASDLRTRAGELQTKVLELSEANARLLQANEAAKAREADVVALLSGAKEEMGKEFQRLSSAVLEEKSAALTEQQKAALSNLIDPFGKHLSEFKLKIDASREADVIAREGMLAQIRQLTTLNQEIGAKAQSLTDALRGENKTQGIWGEAILEKILELVGFREGREFRTQIAGKGTENQRLIPDVVLDLPRGRSIVIDSKVSLVAYEKSVAATDSTAKEQALKDHVASLQRHIRDLSKKDYPQLYGLASVDFVLLFVPIESALMAASEADGSLASYAIERHVALVSPNTLFTVLRTIEYIWRVEQTTRNMDDIVKRGGLMYDAAVRFAEHMVAISTHLQKANAAYQSAHFSLTEPSRGLIRQAERLRNLGVKPKRAMPATLSLDGEAEGLEADAKVVAEQTDVSDADQHIEVVDDSWPFGGD